MRKITPTIILMTLYMCVLQNKSLSKKRLEAGVFVAFKMSFVKQSGMYKNSSGFFKLLSTSIHFFSTLIKWISFIVNFMQVP